MRLSKFRIACASAAMASLLTAGLTGCGSSPAAAADKPAYLKSSYVLGKVGALGKSVTINLSKLIVVAISNATPADTLRDTSAVSGNAQVTVNRLYTLKPLRSWIVTATSKDSNDSVIHTASTISFYVRPADTAIVTLSLTSRFSMYQAVFSTLPDSIGASTGSGKEQLKVKRLTLSVDGVVKVDTSAPGSAYFAARSTNTLNFDYVTVGSHVALLEAYGDFSKYTGRL